MRYYIFVALLCIILMILGLLITAYAAFSIQELGDAKQKEFSFQLDEQNNIVSYSWVNKWDK